MGTNNFLALATITAGSSVGPLPSVDLWTLVPSTGLQSGFTVICVGDFTGVIAIEGSLDNVNFSPVGTDAQGSLLGGFSLGQPPVNGQVATHLSPLNVDAVVRYFRARVAPGTAIRGDVTLTIGGGQNCNCGSASGIGATGPAGATGATGPAGPQGATGPAGSGGASNTFIAGSNMQIVPSGSAYMFNATNARALSSITDAVASNTIQSVGFPQLWKWSSLPSGLDGLTLESDNPNQPPLQLLVNNPSGSASNNLDVIHRSSTENPSSPSVGFGARLRFVCYGGAAASGVPGVYEYGALIVDNSSAATPGFFSGRFRLAIVQGAPGVAAPEDILTGDRQSVVASRSVVPVASGAYDLGSSVVPWRSGYFSGDGTKVFSLPSDGTVSATPTATGRIPIVVNPGGITKYLRYFND